MPDEIIAPGGSAGSGRHRGAQTVLASLAAVAGVLAASSCCWPLLPFVAAAGFAGSAALLSAARPYLLVASVFFDCLRVLSGAAGEEVWASTARRRVYAAVAIHSLRRYYDFLSADHGECDRQLDGTVST